MFVTKSRAPNSHSESEKVEMEMRVGLMGKLVQTCYAVLCLGVVLVSVTVAHYVFSEEMAEDPQERSKRRLRALHGRALHLR
ncbi:hypothetical protein SAY87_013502 [Trapa incisa]|uniref:Uncharacterized protein n=1 Tax=Trapa incisa TaxID=236973 RepID=A0AAN7KBM3_9MYRT|nr:hypothetical protein SAY87_013502 [Trapa incisa]